MYASCKMYKYKIYYNDVIKVAAKWTNARKKIVKSRHELVENYNHNEITENNRLKKVLRVIFNNLKRYTLSYAWREIGYFPFYSLLSVQ